MGAQGSTSLDFGAFPGSAETTIDVSGQTGFTSSSAVEAWILPVATTEHSVEEHMIENLDVIAYYKSAGVFTIRGCVRPFFQENSINNVGSQANLLYGNFTIGWVWN